MQDDLKAKYAFYAIMVYFFQMGMISVLFTYSALNMYSELATCLSTAETEIIYVQWLVMIAKVIMTNMLHTRIEPEAAAGVRMIKFALNHPNRFQDRLWFAACLAGWAKVTVIFMCEGLNIMAMLM
jgi:hypothetical protein